MAFKCKECGCTCKKCLASDRDVELHVEIENLKQRLLERENHIVMMETNFLNEANKFPSGEMIALREELLTWQDKYKRLYEGHRRVQRVNQGLEDKLLKLVDICETEKNTLTRDIATISQNLAEANYAIKKLTEDNERYKNDVNLAIQFLQCKQTNFVAHRFDRLPTEVQTQIAAYMDSKRKPPSLQEEHKQNKPNSNIVPISTFPPTAMFYNMPKTPELGRKVEEEEEAEGHGADIVSASIMAKVLEERQKERALVKHCDSCTCAKTLKIVYNTTYHHVGTQTMGEFRENLCLKCNDVIKPVPLVAQAVKPSLNLNQDLPKKSSPYPTLTSLDAPQCIQNIVKVQPNNFMLEKGKTESLTSSVNTPKTELIRLDMFPSESSLAQDLTDLNATNDLIDLSVTSDRRAQDLADFSLTNELSIHHKNCTKITPSFDLESTMEKSDLEKNVDKTSSKKETLKGPRYCSMLVQQGSNNILLDNAHSNVAPVLYTRSKSTVKLPTPQQYRKLQCNLQENQKRIEIESVSSHESVHKLNSLASENSAQHHQRVAEWVRGNLDNESFSVSSPDHSRSEETSKTQMEIDQARYREMEENVKRFLFGESEFLKTVELGKLKYKSFSEKAGIKVIKNETPVVDLHNETEI